MLALSLGFLVAAYLRNARGWFYHIICLAAKHMLRKLENVYDDDAVVVIVEPVEIEGADGVKQFYYFTPEEKWVCVCVDPLPAVAVWRRPYTK